jgi:hypothetical protein
METREKAQVLQRAELQVVIGSFEGDTDPSIIVSVPGAEIAVEHSDVALVPVEQPDQDVLGRALARAAWAEESEDLAWLDRKGHSANSGPLCTRIRKAEGVDIDHGHLAVTVAANRRSGGLSIARRRTDVSGC